MTYEEYQDLLDDLETAERDLSSAESANTEGRIADPDLHLRTIQALREKVARLRQEADRAWALFDEE